MSTYRNSDQLLKVAFAGAIGAIVAYAIVLSLPQQWFAYGVGLLLLALLAALDSGARPARRIFWAPLIASFAIVGAVIAL